MPKVKITRVDFSLSEEYCEGDVTFVLNGKEYTAFSYGTPYIEGEEADVEFDCLDKQSIKELITGNPSRRKELVHIGEQSYEGYGEVISVDPIIVDFGDGIMMEMSNESKDVLLIGTYIYCDIIRFDIHRKD